MAANEAKPAESGLFFTLAQAKRYGQHQEYQHADTDLLPKEIPTNQQQAVAHRSKQEDPHQCTRHRGPAVGTECGTDKGGPDGIEQECIARQRHIRSHSRRQQISGIGLLIGLLSLCLTTPGMAEDSNFTGTWQSISGQSTFTKPVVHDAHTVTYCYVQSCRQQDCWKWQISGDTNSTFTYEYYTGNYEFTRLGDNELEVEYTNPSGDLSFAFYNPQ